MPIYIYFFLSFLQETMSFFNFHILMWYQCSAITNESLHLFCITGALSIFCPYEDLMTLWFVAKNISTPQFINVVLDHQFLRISYIWVSHRNSDPNLGSSAELVQLALLLGHWGYGSLCSVKEREWNSFPPFSGHGTNSRLNSVIVEGFYLACFSLLTRFFSLPFSSGSKHLCGLKVSNSIVPLRPH